MSSVYLPPEVRLQMLRDAFKDAEIGEPTCPAAEIGEYADSRHKYVNCKVEQRHFPVDEARAAVVSWCCADFTACPVWQERDSKVAQRVLAAKRAKDAKEAEKGLRAADPDEERFQEQIQREVEGRNEAIRKLNEGE